MASRSRPALAPLHATARASVIALGCVAASSCNDGKGQAEAPSSADVRIENKTPGEWMRRGEDFDPAIWLATKEQGRPASPTDPHVERLKKALQLADSYFLESERMIANRTAQLAGMLAADGMPEDYATIVEELSAVVDTKWGKATYGELCQYYHSLRRGGADKPEALRVLAERYGSPDRRR